MPNSIIINCKKCGMPLKKGTKICSYCGENTGYLFNRKPREKERAIRIGGFKIAIPWVTLILIVLNAVAGIYKLAGGQYDVLRHFGMIQGALQRGELQRLFLSSFLHFDLSHFFSNMYGLAIFGFVFENRIGKWKYLLIYIASMLGSGLLINFIGGTGLHAGASGAIWGLMAANLVYNLITRKKFLYMLYAFVAVIGNVLSTFAAGISWQGHFGGAIAGVIAALLLFKQEKQEKKIEKHMEQIENFTTGASHGRTV